MSDEIIRKDERVTETDEALSTADLAGTNRAKSERRTLRETMSCKRNGAERISPVGRSLEMPNRTATAANRTVAGQRQAELRLREQRQLLRGSEESGPLFSSTEANQLRGRWDAIQVGFVDEPRRAVEQADNLGCGHDETASGSVRRRTRQIGRPVG